MPRHIEKTPVFQFSLHLGHRRSRLLAGNFWRWWSFPLVKGHFAVRYMCCTHGWLQAGRSRFSSTTEERWRGERVSCSSECGANAIHEGTEVVVIA
jgi:hypothetical protein